jgi:hypothetical protein
VAALALAAVALWLALALASAGLAATGRRGALEAWVGRGRHA